MQAAPVLLRAAKDNELWNTIYSAKETEDKHEQYSKCAAQDFASVLYHSC